MANVAAVVEYKSGGYTIEAGGQNKPFTFWWGSDAEGSEYFNVSIAPDSKLVDLIPLIEVKREIGVFNGTPRQPMLILTLTNNNPFEVHFTANHIRV
jgi:hypothetical protein